MEKCSDIKEQYTCACPEHFQGKRCEKFYPQVKSCQAIWMTRPGPYSGVYNLVISENKTVKTYCDFSSETGTAWTLIESFSLSNKEFYKNKPFYHDFPRNENNFTWLDFRVSYQALVNIRDNSTHWRVTCDFPSGLSYTDYARASLKDTDLLTFVNQDKCQRYEFVSARGINCTDCTGMLFKGMISICTQILIGAGEMAVNGIQERTQKLVKIILVCTPILIHSISAQKSRCPLRSGGLDQSCESQTICTQLYLSLNDNCIRKNCKTSCNLTTPKINN